MQDLIQFYETIYSIHENRSPYGANLSFSFLDVEKKNLTKCAPATFLPISTLQIAMHLLPWDHPYITSATGLGGSQCLRMNLYVQKIWGLKLQ